MSIRLKTGLLADTETTGLKPGSDEIFELGLILFSYNEETGEIVDTLEEAEFLREPLSAAALRNYPGAYRVHGIPFDHVAGKVFDDSKIKKMFSYSDTILAHNASFDRSFLYHMYPEVNDLKWYCTMRNIPWKKYGFQSGSLLSLLKAHGISGTQQHRAMDDIIQLMALLKQPNHEGFPYLREVMQKKPMKKYEPSARASGYRNWQSSKPMKTVPFEQN
ncbi:DNA polymerase III subunit epsilon [Neobacillus notoginsengisoli]|uniref:DNA polymerase III subunit epsilon n=1 Tax=Neobacillus notoginsengisoli TaxID=1578198 RepID=A0A417YX28_9BACI|nr:exonuclease domain-containing protein [Neobacillus notoginsengisoli]RHW42079.1 DNA polymerase III subunit epsilon [Neobacillus notoginsengisoli]